MYTYVHPFSLHDALPISRYRGDAAQRPGRSRRRDRDDVAGLQRGERGPALAAHGHRRVAARQHAGLAAGEADARGAAVDPRHDPRLPILVIEADIDTEQSSEELRGGTKCVRECRSRWM